MKKHIILIIVLLNIIPFCINLKNSSGSLFAQERTGTEEVKVCARYQMKTDVEYNLDGGYEITTSDCYYDIDCETGSETERCEERSPSRTFDCKGDENGTAYIDPACGCVSTLTEVGDCQGLGRDDDPDCAGVAGGSAYQAPCGCIGGTTGIADCPPQSTSTECQNFDKTVKHVLKSEGGYVNDPHDKGGPTNKGIAWETWKNAAKPVLGKEPTLDNLKAITSDDAKNIYKGLYWDKVRADDIKDGDLRYLLFDFKVTSGGSVRVLQETINQLSGNVKADGRIGSKTIEAANAANKIDLYNTLKQNRIKYYEGLVKKDAKNAGHLKGWKNRVNSFKDKTKENPTDVNCK